MNAYKLTSVLALAALPFAASAATQTFSDTFAWNAAGTDTLVLNQFDSSLGTLTAVNVEVTAAKTGGSGAADNDSELSGSVIFSQVAAVNFTSTDVSFDDGFSSSWINLSAESTSGSIFVDVTSGDATGIFDNTGDTDHVTWDAPDANDSANADIDASRWSAGTGYIGTGTFDITVAGTQSTNTTGLSVNTSQSPADVSGTIKVTYTYTAVPVPEPSSYALLAGVAAFGWIMVRRRK